MFSGRTQEGNTQVLYSQDDSLQFGVTSITLNITPNILSMAAKPSSATKSWPRPRVTLRCMRRSLCDLRAKWQRRRVDPGHLCYWSASAKELESVSKGDEQTTLKDIRKIVGRLLQGVAVGQRYK